jgi:Flp pilus assembly protein TadG
MVEFALVLPLLLMLALGVLDFGKALNYWIDETHLANEGARWAVVNSNPGGSSLTLQQYLQQQADSAELRSNAQICISNPGGGTFTVGNPVQVTVLIHYTWLPFFPNWLGFPTTTKVVGNAIMRLEANATNYGSGNNIGTCT